MKSMLSSASRVSFLLLIMTACAGFLLGKLSPELFVPIVMSGTGAYFVSKSQEVKTPPTV